MGLFFITKTKSKRIFYFDALRALAILSVILIHVFNSVKNAQPSFCTANPSIYWLLAAGFGNYTRIGVDLFLMLSGALSLGRQWDIKTFLGKRIPRIVLPFLFWGFVLSVVMVAFSYLYPDTFVSVAGFNLKSFLTFLSNNYLAVDTVLPFWFFWMILGTYLFMPILNKWLLLCDLKEVEYFLVIWAVTCICVYTFDIAFPVKLTYFTGPIGVVLLGYYLRHTQRKIFRNPYFIVSLLVVSFILVLANTFEFSLTGSFHKINRYNIFIILEVIAIFLLFRNFSDYLPSLSLSDDSIFKKATNSIAKYSYGMYLIHRPIVIMLCCLITLNLDPYIQIIIFFILSAIVSWAVMAGLNKIPYMNKVIGSK